MTPSEERVRAAQIVKLGLEMSLTVEGWRPPVEGAIKIIDEYLREHHEDDDEPVSVEWMESVGLGENFDPVETLISIIEKGHEGAKEGDVCKSFATRGSVRRLCRGIGFSLRENRSARDQRERA